VRLLIWADIWNIVDARDFAVWVWFERLSWFVALAGFPFLVYQVRVLQRDQRRLADELSMRPKIDFGFLTGREPAPPPLPREITIEPNWPPGRPASAPVKVTFAAVNIGTRTARNVVFNLQLGSGEQQERKIARTTDIHPGVFQPFAIDIEIPTGLTELPIQTTASMDDTLPQQFSVTLKVRAAPPPAADA
jgi:hypothetical protein